MDLKITKQPIYAVKFPKNSKWPYLSGILPHFIGGIKAKNSTIIMTHFYHEIWTKSNDVFGFNVFRRKFIRFLRKKGWFYSYYTTLHLVYRQLIRPQVKTGQLFDVLMQ